MDMGIHCIDLLRYVTGLQVQAVTAICANQIHRYPDVEDAGTAVLKMSNGALFSVSANFNVPYGAGGSSFWIYGTKGSIAANKTLGQTEIGTVYHINIEHNNGEPLAISYDDKNMYTKQIESFSDSLLFDAPVPVSADEGVTDQRIVQAIYESNKTGTYIELR